MEIRIDLTTDGSKTVVHVAGRLSGNAVGQLKKACGPIEDPFVMDLSNLLFADDAGIDSIRALAAKGAQVQKASPFVQLLLFTAPGWKTTGEESTPSQMISIGETL
jgi:anti-anti-sigma regulatory factor